MAKKHATYNIDEDVLEMFRQIAYEKHKTKSQWITDKIVAEYKRLEDDEKEEQ